MCTVNKYTMGKAKFPGKPSKSVVKERIYVLNKNEYDRGQNSEKKSEEHTCNNSYNPCMNPKNEIPFIRGLATKIVNSVYIQANQRSSLSNSEQETTIKKYCTSDLLGTETVDFQKNYNLTSKSSATATRNKKTTVTDQSNHNQKKTVTFKNILENSDATFRNIHNPLDKKPLVSILKKSCLKSQHYMLYKDRIVRPSRLTKILKNNGNIDKTKLLSFRSVHLPIESFNSHEQQSDQHDGSYSLACKIFLTDEEGKKNNCKSKDCNKNCTKLANENKYQLPDKWDLQEIGQQKNNFGIGDDVARNECKKQLNVKKDSTAYSQNILRQPRLLYAPQDNISAKSKPNTSNDGTEPYFSVTKLCYNSVCGVCNTSVNHKNIQQNRKYGITACKFCKTFISKISKRTIAASRSSSNIFKIQCIDKKGECSITSLPKNIEKCFKQIYNERCSACWLKKCIQSFHFPLGHKLRLNTVISEVNNTEIKLVHQSQETLDFKNGIEKCNTDSEPNFFSWNQNIAANGTKEAELHQKQISLPTNNTEKFVNSKSISEPRLEDSCSDGINTRLKFPFNDNLHPVPSKSIEFQANSVSTTDNLKRQKNALRGPRVKHVCRSASIALGQKIATFSNVHVEALQLQQSKSEIESCSFKHLLKGNLLFFESDEENISQRSIKDEKQINMQLENQIKCVGIDDVDLPKKIFDIKKHTLDKNLNFFIDETPDLIDLQSNVQKIAHKCGGIALFSLACSNKSLESNKNLVHLTNIERCEKKTEMISIDFWNTYVPTEVNQTGFGLILTKPASIFALCFLCGSMDLSYLLFCVSCCEPYHSYCIQEGLIVGREFFDEKEVSGQISNQLKWMCPRCTVCNTCNMSSGPKIKCQKCKKNYHNTCMGSSKRLLGADRPLICKSCLKCQFCPSKNVSKYVGNQPTCIQCFKQKLSISNCTICQKCVDIVLDLIILECGLCNEFVHAKCEGLIEEQSYLLSNIAGNIKFVCKKCCVANDKAKLLAKEWREAVYKELQLRLLKVLKLLSRSPLGEILKKSTQKSYQCCLDKVKGDHPGLFSSTNENEKTKEDSKGPHIHKIQKNFGSKFQSRCLCSKSTSARQTANPLSLLDIKKKIIKEEYVSLFDFNADINSVIIPLKNDDLILTYKEIISEQFSWFQNETKTCTDALEEDMIDSCIYSFQIENSLIEDQISSTKLPLPGSEETVFSSFKRHIDTRTCIFCLKEGDGENLQESRLLYYGFDSWVHANCALWSMAVYEEFDGSLQNVHSTYSRGRRIRCFVCKHFGATIKCNVKTCCRYYHFKCARKSECLFKYETSMFCPLHKTGHTIINTHLSNEILSLSRPLHIECHKSHKKYIEPFNVQFMIGSLCVIELGNIISPFSDTTEAIVPINFICTRLYWSSKEPWKVVKYKVQTSIQNGSVTLNNELDTHFTVDHSKTRRLVERDLSQILCWQNTLTRDKSREATSRNECDQFKIFGFSNNVGYRHEASFGEFIEEEQQNNSDLLPPEIEEAIFKDLPNDVLDGISMLDIFPKLMIHEDLAEGKLEKSADTFASQQPIDCLLLNSLKKQDSKPSAQKREQQRSNSKVFIRNLKCYDKGRYFTKDILGSNFNGTRVPSLNCNRPKEKVWDCKWKLKKSLLLEKNENLKQFRKDETKLVQLDGAEDHINGYLKERNVISKIPVECDRCQCTYRTLDSFRRHFVNCEQTSTSESEAETSQSLDITNFGVFLKDDSNENNFLANHNQPVKCQNAATVKPVSNSNIFKSEAIITPNIANIESFSVNFDKSRDQCKLFSKVGQDKVGTPHKSHITGQNTHDNANYLQIFNQNITCNNQHSHKEQQPQLQQLEMFDQSASQNQPMFIHQVQNAVPTMPQNVFPGVLSNNSIQYASIPAFTSSLVQAPSWHSDCNVMLSSGLQMMPMSSIQVAPPLVSFFNPSQIGSNQVLLGGAQTMSLMPNTSQFFLAPQPIYYNLETIVQNTVMSSQQFVSTAMQGFLSQNGSFSATTTQVFQSSKFEPVGDASSSSSYVVLNNTDGIMLVFPQLNCLSEVIDTNSSHDLHIANSSDYVTPNVYNPQNIVQKPELNNIIPLLLTLPEVTNALVDKPINKLDGTRVIETSTTSNPAVETTTLVENRVETENENLLSQHWILNPKLCSMEKVHEDNQSTITVDLTNDYNFNSLKEVRILEMGNTTLGVIETTEQNKVHTTKKNVKKKNSQIPPQTDLKIMHKKSVRKEFKVNQPKDFTFERSSKKTGVYTKLLDKPRLNDTSVCLAPEVTASLKMDFESLKDGCESPQLKITESIQNVVNRSKRVESINSYLMNVPTNRVEPIMLAKEGKKTTCRPTNRVLPMQSMNKAADRSKPKNSMCSSENIKNHASLEAELLKTIPTTKKKIEYIKPTRQMIEADKRIIDSSENLSDFSANTCLLKVIQKHSLNSPMNSMQKIGKTFLKNDFSEDAKHIMNQCSKYVPSKKKRNEKQPITQEKKVCNMNSKKSADQSDYINLKCFNSSLTKSLNQFKPDQQANVVFASQEPLKVECQKNSTESYLMYEVQSEDGFRYKSQSIADAWLKVFQAVQSSRHAHSLPSYPIGPFADICGVQMLGLKTNALKYLIEQLPGTEKCQRYIPKYHTNASPNVKNSCYTCTEEDLHEYIVGAARCEPIARRSAYDMFSWLASKHRKQPRQIFVQPSDTELIARRCTTNLPMAMKYRTLKETCKLNVGVFWSVIHGRGLFCIKDVEAGEMVIEYAGELIRSTLADKRERFYDSRGIGCYMFKIDEHIVVDATMRGNAARFINHSCEPNCYSKVVDILGHKHIIIFSLRRVVQGEELTYDYKFPFEEVKIYCYCASKKCRKYLN